MTVYTAKGYPYADEAEALADMPATSQILAELLNSRLKVMESGSFTIALTANTTADKIVSFTQPFTDAPKVVAIPMDASPELIFISLKQAPTNIAVTFRCRRTTTANGTFYWFAHG